MVKLKDVYPLYLNNKAEQPNADLEVTDKYTGKVAFRVAQADAKTIDAGIQGAVEAAEPMARLPSYARQAVLQHCVDRFKERFDELAYAHTSFFTSQVAEDLADDLIAHAPEGLAGSETLCELLAFCARDPKVSKDSVGLGLVIAVEVEVSYAVTYRD